MDNLICRMESLKDGEHDDSVEEYMSTRIWNKAIQACINVVKNTDSKRKENTACFTRNEVDLVCSAIIDSPVDTPRELQDKVLTVLKNNMTILE